MLGFLDVVEEETEAVDGLDDDVSGACFADDALEHPQDVAFAEESVEAGLLEEGVDLVLLSPDQDVGHGVDGIFELGDLGLAGLEVEAFDDVDVHTGEMGVPEVLGAVVVQLRHVI